MKRIVFTSLVFASLLFSCNNDIFGPQEKRPFPRRGQTMDSTKVIHEEFGDFERSGTRDITGTARLSAAND